MKASSNDRYINGEYFNNNPDWDKQDAPWKAATIHMLLQRNKIHPVAVTEVGCGAGANLIEMAKLDPAIKNLKGYDISPQAIAMAKENRDERISYTEADFTNITTPVQELLLVIDVVEHVDDYYGFLRKLKARSNYFVFHIPLDLSCRTVMKPHVLLQQRDSVGHIHYFTKTMVDWAMADTGYEILDWVYTKPVADTVPARSFKQWVKKILRNISFSLFPDWSVKKWGNYSIMLLAK